MSGEAIVNGILMDSFWAFAVIGLGLATIAGILLVIAPGTALKLAARLNREFSIAWVQTALDAPRTAEPFIYRHHRIVGSLLTLATLYFFWQFFTSYRQQVLVDIYQGVLPIALLEALASTFTIVLVLGNSIGLVLGLVIVVRPSLLKGAESWANRWVGSEKVTDALDRKIGGPENLTHRYPRRVGLLILFAVVYILLIAAIVLK